MIVLISIAGLLFQINSDDISFEQNQLFPIDTNKGDSNKFNLLEVEKKPLRILNKLPNYEQRFIPDKDTDRSP